MEDITKRKVGDALPEEQSSPNKSIVVGPFSERDPAKLLLGVGSSFQPWQQNPSWKGLGAAEASSSGTKPYLHLANMKIENPTPDHVEKNPINGGGATSGVGADDNTPHTDEAQVDQPGSGGNTQPEMDPRKLKRIIANRVSAQKSRMRRNEYISDLESKATSYQNKISLLHPQIAAYKNHQRSLLLEHHKLKLQMVAREKQRIFQEAEIEKKKAEVNRLSELERRKLAEEQARILNTGAAMQRMSYSNLNASGLGRLVCSNSDQAQNGEETSRMQGDMAQQPPQNQSQMWQATWDNGQRSIPNLNLGKSEPQS